VSRHRHRSIGATIVGVVFLVIAGFIVFIVFFNNSSFLQRPLPVPFVSVAGNWAGYVAASNLFFPQAAVTAVSASWTVPTVKDIGVNAYSAVWVGVGGMFDSSLIQVGTEQDYADGAATYYAWYEMLPANQIKINSMQISPGDMMQASIDLADSGSNTWSISIEDQTTGQSFQQNFEYNSGKLSAEWIVERPQVNGALAELANFGSVTFSGCQATLSGRTGGIADFSDNRIYMEPEVLNNQSIQLVNVSGVGGDAGFSVDYVGGA
jgi:hypothetical protein